MIHHEVDDDANSALLGGVGEFDEVAERAVARIHLVIVRNVITAVAVGRGLKRHEPDRSHAEPVQVVEAAHESGKVADAAQEYRRYLTIQPTSADAERLKVLVERHLLHTGSARARALLDNWEETLSRFVKVMPTDYARALADMKAERAKAVAAE